METEEKKCEQEEAKKETLDDIKLDIALKEICHWI